jgi:hypothetical protein
VHDGPYKKEPYTHGRVLKAAARNQLLRFITLYRINHKVVATGRIALVIFPGKRIPTTNPTIVSITTTADITSKIVCVLVPVELSIIASCPRITRTADITSTIVCVLAPTTDVGNVC